MRITSAGNVGIGITAPTKKLHIKDTTQTNQSLLFGPHGAAYGEINYNSTGLEHLYIDAHGTTTGYGNIVLRTGPDPATRMFIHANGNVGINVEKNGNSIRLVIKNDGVDIAGNIYTPNNISSGTSSSLKGYFYESTGDQNGTGKPSSVVGLAANINSRGEGPSIDFNAIWGGGGVYQQDNWNEGWTVGRIAGVYDSSGLDTGALSFYTQTSGSSGGASSASLTEKMRISSNGKVGIGETTPLGTLHVKSTDSGATADGSADDLVVENNSNTGISILSGTASTGSIYFGDSVRNWDGYIAYSHGSSPSMTIASNAGASYIKLDDIGNVGINTTSPEHHLHVTEPGSNEDGIVKIGGSNAGLGLELRYNQASNTETDIIANPTYTNVNSVMRLAVDGDANANQLVLKGNGNVGIGTEASPGYTLEVKKSVNSDWLSRIYNTGTTDGSGLLVRSDTADSQAPVVLGVYSGGSYKMFVRGDGTVTQPKQPTAIYTHSVATEDGAYGYDYGVTSGAASVYCRPQTAVVNRGNMYTPSNGRFTAPQAGIYRYAVHGNLYTVGITSTAYWTIRVWKNTSHYIYHYEANSTNAAGSWIYVNAGGTIELAANDYVRFQLVTNAKGGQNNHFGWDLANYTHYEFQLLY
jgi:hypothetical protein